MEVKRRGAEGDWLAWLKVALRLTVYEVDGVVVPATPSRPSHTSHHHWQHSHHSHYWPCWA